MLSHYLDQCWVIVNRAIANRFQWNLNQNKTVFIHKNAFANVVGKIATIPLCIDLLSLLNDKLLVCNAHNPVRRNDTNYEFGTLRHEQNCRDNNLKDFLQEAIIYILMLVPGEEPICDKSAMVTLMASRRADNTL